MIRDVLSWHPTDTVVNGFISRGYADKFSVEVSKPKMENWRVKKNKANNKTENTGQTRTCCYMEPDRLTAQMYKYPTL